MRGWWSAVSESGRTLRVIVESVLLPIGALLMICTWGPWIWVRTAISEGMPALELTAGDLLTALGVMVEAVAAPFVVLFALFIWMPLWRVGLIEDVTTTVDGEITISDGALEQDASAELRSAA